MNRRLPQLICFVALLVVILCFRPLTLTVAQDSSGATTCVSVSSAGIYALGSGYPAISGDGRFLVFHSGAPNLIVGDTNNSIDVFIHDRQSRETRRLAVFSERPAISSDGRFVSFRSIAALVNGDTNNTADIFVFDRQTGQTTRVSVSSTGIEGDNWSDESRLSADGRYVVFDSAATNLVEGDTNNRSDVFVHDRYTSQTVRVSVSSTGEQGNWDSRRSSISADGRYVAFTSEASNLVEGDTNGWDDVFVHDSLTGQTSRISVSSTGEQANYLSDLPAISADGRYVTFDSGASNLIEGDTNDSKDVFIHDRLTGQTRRVSVNSAGMQANNTSYESTLSADGRYIAFSSQASNLVDGDTNVGSSETNLPDVFVHDQQTGKTTRVSLSSTGGQGNGGSQTPSISADGRYIAFWSQARNLVLPDKNGNVGDLYVHDQEGTSTPPTISGVSPQLGSAGTPVTIIGANFAGATEVRFNGTEQPTFTVNQAGTQIQVAVPRGASTGKIAITVLGATAVSQSDFTVIPPPAPTILDFSPTSGGIGSTVTINGANFDGTEGVSFNGTNQPAFTVNLAGTQITASVPIGATTGKINVIAPTGVATSGGTFTVTSNPVALTRISLSSSGEQGNNDSYNSALSANGRYVAFDSFASNFVTGDTNDSADIFVRDRQTGQTTLISRSADGTLGNNSSLNPSISADGRYVVFESLASNLVANDTNGTYDIFLFDRNIEEIILISRHTNGTQGNVASKQPSISASGRYVAFTSFASNLVDGSSQRCGDQSCSQIYVRDLQTGETTRVSSDAAGTQGNEDSTQPSISADGRYVVFTSGSSNLIGTDTNGKSDIFLHDSVTHITSLVSQSNGNQANNHSSNPVISSNGQYVAFDSNATNLTAGDTTTTSDIYLYELQTGKIALVSVGLSGLAGPGSSNLASVSSDGRYIAFMSGSETLTTSLDRNNRPDIFLRDMLIAQTYLISVTEAGTPGNDTSSDPGISANGRFVTFVSLATNLVAGDVNGRPDIFIHDRGGAALYQISGQLLNQSTGEPIAGATLRIGEISVASGSNGIYTIADLAPGNYTVIPSKPGLMFSPSSRVVMLPPDADGVSFVARPLDVSAITRVSVGSSGTQANNRSKPLGVSTNGRYVLFASHASNLLPNDFNDAQDVFRKDLWTGLTELASTNIIGAGGSGNSGDLSPDYSSGLSGDGRFAVFSSDASDLVPNDTNNVADIFIRDFVLGTTTRIVTTPGGEQFDGGPSFWPAISDDGRFVTFLSGAVNVAPGPNTDQDLYLYDAQTGELTRVTYRLEEGHQYDEASGTISRNGRYVVFGSLQAHYVSGLDNNGARGAFVYDRQSGTYDVLHTLSADVYASTITDDGSSVMFSTWDTRFLEGAASDQWQGYRYHRGLDSIEIVSVNELGQPANGDSRLAVQSADGDYEFFSSYATNLTAFNRSARSHIYVREPGVSALNPVDTGLLGEEANGDSSFIITSSNGRFVLFRSCASNLVSDDTNASCDVFLKEIFRPADGDNDGIAGNIENGAPNGDGNNDGVPDSEQVNVTSLPNTADGQYVTLESPPGTELTDVQAAENPAPATAPASTDFPVGFLRFNIAGLTAGAAVTVEIYVEGGVTAETYYKYGMTPANPTDHWYEFVYDGETGAEILSDKIVLHFVDGKRGDGDLTANGILNDPGAPARKSRQTMTLNPIADAYTSSANTTGKYGTATTLRVKDSSDDFYSFLRFDVAGLACATVLDASLRLHVTDAGPDAGSIYTVSNNWTESGITWSNDPAITGTPLDSPGAAVLGEYTTFDVTTAMTGNGPLSFGLKNASRDQVFYASRETSKPPELVIQYQTNVGAPTAAFSATPTSGQAGLQVAFTDASDGCPASWVWDFGDGGASIEQNPTHIYASPGTYTVSLTVTNARGTDTESKSGFVTVGAAVPPIFLSATSSGTVGGKAFTGADILSYVKTTNTWDILYDGSSVNTAKNVGAFAFQGNDILLGFSLAQVVPGLGATAIPPQDLVRFTPTRTGYNNTAGSFAWFFDGSDVGLTTSGEIIDALWIDASGRLYISTTGTAKVNGPTGVLITAHDEDVLRFTPTSTGATTVGTWELFWDPTLMTGMSAEDVNGYWEDPATGDRYVTILGAFTVGNAAYGGRFTGNGQTILRFAPNAAAPGGWAPAEKLTWLAMGATFPSNIDGIEMAQP